MLLSIGQRMGRNAKTTATERLSERIGKNIKAARLRIGRKQSEIAELLGVEDATISRIETGAQLPSLERLNEISKILQVSLSALVGDTTQGDNLDELLVGALRDLPVREKEFVYTFALQYAQHWRASKRR